MSIESGHRARKRFGQNFLHDRNIIERIIATMAPKSGDRLVEIGPGLGAMTLPLLKAAGRLVAVELDRDLIEPLEGACRELGHFEIHNVDALTFDFANLAQEGPIRVAGNLPYNISTPLLFHLFDQARHIQDMHFMLQKEVVDRLAAGPGSKTYGRLSVMAQYYCQVTALFRVPPGAFRPAPKVDSAIVRLVPHDTPPVDVPEPRHLEQVVARAFGQRRKTLRNTLKGLVTAEAMSEAGIDPGARAETLDLPAFAQLARLAFADQR